MASLTMALVPGATGGGRAYAATAAKSTGRSGGEESGLWDWVLRGLQKEEQLFETDPILQKKEDDGKVAGGSTTSTTGGRKTSVAVPPKKNGGFGGLFAKK